MGRKPCCAKEGLNKGAWSAREDKILTDYININGEGKWRDLPKRAGLKRCGKSCRLRWLNYLRPDIKRGNITPEEEDLIIRLHKLLGNRWSLIAGRLPGRTDNEIKNYWNTILSKRVVPKGDEDDQDSTKRRRGKSKGKKNGGTERSSKELKDPETEPKETLKAIRTKAFRCTKVVVPSLQLEEDDHQVFDKSTSLPNSDSESLSSIPVKLDDNNSSGNNFLMDFNIDELLNSSEIVDGENWIEPICRENNSDNDLAAVSGGEAKRVLDDEAIRSENWMDDIDTFQSDYGVLDLNVLSSFLNSENDRWICT
ncbi:hypothetical protein UlMin_021982 [Ulmus minor]